MPPRFLRSDPNFKYGETVAHFGEVTVLQASACGKYVFSAGQDGIIFVYEVQEYTPKTNHRSANVKQESANAQGMIDTGKAQSDHEFDGKKSSIVSGTEANTVENDSIPKSPTMQS